MKEYLTFQYAMYIMVRRIYSFDTIRSIAIVFIVIIHTDPFRTVGLTGNAINFTIDTIARFAVPLFFLIAGYLFSMNIRRKTSGYARAYLKRVAAAYIFGVVLLLPIRLLLRSGRAMLGNDPVEPQLISEIFYLFNPTSFLYYGDSVGSHLWFLPALGYSILLIYLAQRNGQIFYLLIAATVFHGIGIAAGAYSVVTGFSFPVRDALFFSLFYTTTGYWLERQSDTLQAINSHRILSLVAVFGLFHLVERFFIGYILGSASGPLSKSVYVADYSILTPFFAISLFLFALSTPTLGEGTCLRRLGVLTIGIYILHVPVLQLIRIAASVTSKFTPYAPSETLVWHFLLTPTVYVLTLFGYIALGRLGVVDHFYEYRGI